MASATPRKGWRKAGDSAEDACVVKHLSAEARSPLLCQGRFAICGFSPGAWHESWSADGDASGSWLGAVWGGGLGVVEEVPDLSGDVAFEAADRFAFGLAF